MHKLRLQKRAVSEAQALEAETRLLAPISGTVSKTYGKPSELVAMGVPVVSILEDDDLWVSLNVGENQYASVYKNKTLEGFIPALNQSVMFKVKILMPKANLPPLKLHVRPVVMTFVVLNYIWCLSVLSKT